MTRSLVPTLALALVGFAASPPTDATAQVRISVEWNDIVSGGPYVYAEYGTGGAYVVASYGQPRYRDRVVRRHRGVDVRRGVRIPPGHLPGPGECRVWYPGVPPGHQPPPFRCADRYRAPHGAGWGYAPDGRYGAYGPEVYGPGAYGYGVYGPEVYPGAQYRGPRGAVVIDGSRSRAHPGKKGRKGKWAKPGRGRPGTWGKPGRGRGPGGR